MKDSTFTSIIAIVCFAVLIIMASCTGSDSKSPSTNSTAQADKPLISSDTLDQHLYILWIETDSIKVHTDDKKRLLLNFYVDNSNSLTLHGWFPADIAADKFDSTHVLKLNIIRHVDEALKITKGTYLGNVVIKRQIIEKIISNAGSTPPKYKYLSFSPRINKGHIFYDLTLSNTLPTVSTPQILGGLDIGSANPTPPRNYNGNE